MPDQREIPQSFPEPAPDAPFIPLRMVNEYVYCPRLAYLMWVQAEWADSADTVEGRIRHRRADAGGGILPEKPPEEEHIHARSVSLSSLKLGISAKLDLVEGDGASVSPVDYKRGKRPHVEKGAYDPERVQLCAQGLLLREHGYECDSGMLYFVESRERVLVLFDAVLIEQTLTAILGLRSLAQDNLIPPPLEDSPKCPRCSLAGICLPDEVRFLNAATVAPRPLFAREQLATPLYVQSPRAWLRKDEERIIIEVEKIRTGEARINDVSQLVLFGSSGLSTPLLHELMRREIPVSFHTYGGWFVGHVVGLGQRNAETRMHQYRVSFDPNACLALARGLVVAKIANSRTMLRRNWRGEGENPDDEFFAPATAKPVSDKAPADLLSDLKQDARHAQRAGSLEELLGVEGSAARRYFQHFNSLLCHDNRHGASSPPKHESACACRFPHPIGPLASSPPQAGEGANESLRDFHGNDTDFAFDFTERNRRPPKDPVNAMLSFAYAMLTREWHIALSAVGLDPYRGYYHQPRFGRPALALDMMEPFRPLVADSVVLTAINNGEVHGGDFIRAAGSCALSDSARKRFIAAFERRMAQEITHPLFGYSLSYRRLFEVQARLLIRHLAGEIPEYPNFVTR